MNYTDLIVGFLLGFFSSLAASGIMRCKHKHDLRRKYGPCAGNYTGHELQGRNLRDQPSSQAVITYLRDNILEIRLSHDEGGRTWQGWITMETADFGTIVWQYVVPAEDCEFGFKRCIWNGHEGRLYLVGESLDGYGREVLIKQGRDPERPFPAGKPGQSPEAPVKAQGEITP
jgi:hypothetical protein